jgi:hypothetical protein
MKVALLALGAGICFALSTIRIPSGYTIQEDGQ